MHVGGGPVTMPCAYSPNKRSLRALSRIDPCFRNLVVALQIRLPSIRSSGDRYHIMPLGGLGRRQAFHRGKAQPVSAVRVAMEHDMGLVPGDRHDDRVGDAASLEHAHEVVAKVVGAEGRDPSGGT